MILGRIHHSRIELDKLAERCVKYVERMECKLQEQVWFEPRKGKSFPGVISQIVTKSPTKKSKSDKENAAVSVPVLSEHIRDNLHLRISTTIYS